MLWQQGEEEDSHTATLLPPCKSCLEPLLAPHLRWCGRGEEFASGQGLKSPFNKCLSHLDLGQLKCREGRDTITIFSFLSGK